MDVASSPAKRRVLAALDPNASSPKAPQHTGLKQPTTKPLPAVIVHELDVARKRPLPEQQLQLQLQQQQPAMRPPSHADHASNRDIEEPARKRPCLQDDSSREVTVNAMAQPEPEQSPMSSSSTISERHSSVSPLDRDHDTSCSVFDASAIDTSQATTLTEPDHLDPQPATAAPNASAGAGAGRIPRRPGPARVLTREEAREKAEILRLRLGLANYKVRTGQTDVPLEQLQVRPLPPLSFGAGRSSSSSSGSSSSSSSSNSGGRSGLQRVAAAASAAAAAAAAVAAAVSAPARPGAPSKAPAQWMWRQTGSNHTSSRPHQQHTGVSGSDGGAALATSRRLLPAAPLRRPGSEEERSSHDEDVAMDDVMVDLTRDGAGDNDDDENEQDEDGIALPRLPSLPPAATAKTESAIAPRRLYSGGDSGGGGGNTAGARLASSGLLGGAASGLLSLSRG
ncbi:hypothetical protein B0T24DRAFT_675997 [Lasiosphaeria ovina]|uniref:Cyclin-dependent kinase n=1 Tax=Lasiosphaeria ovina TaxID=92902 RepID=A0AAE0TUJ3_9PEZI|nr:hypothetical protein B0T24DRAFT_675997 [Lasiosphaeria ovina]